MVSVVVPELVNVAVCGRLVFPISIVPKLNSEEEKLTLVPTPLRVTVWGELGSLSVMVTEPVRVPEASGVKLTLMVQVDRGGTTEQALVCEKSAPDTETLETVRLPVP